MSHRATRTSPILEGEVCNDQPVAGTTTASRSNHGTKGSRIALSVSITETEPGKLIPSQLVALGVWQGQFLPHNGTSESFF
jgi:hypothetical protein